MWLLKRNLQHQCKKNILKGFKNALFVSLFQCKKRKNYASVCPSMSDLLCDLILWCLVWLIFLLEQQCSWWLDPNNRSFVKLAHSYDTEIGGETLQGPCCDDSLADEHKITHKERVAVYSDRTDWVPRVSQWFLLMAPNRNVDKTLTARRTNTPQHSHDTPVLSNSIFLLPVTTCLTDSRNDNILQYSVCVQLGLL